MSNLKETIQDLSKSYWEEIRDIRHHLHQNPELSFQEYNTADFIESKLKSFGLENIRRMSKTGVILDMDTGKDGPSIALRADIDALPIQEQNTTDYKSQNDGVMHACGHDVHTSCLLGAVRILNEVKDQLKGRVRFIFQPGEEKLPGGASLLIKEGVLKNPEPSSILGQHVMPFLPVGKVGFRPGRYMASADELYLTIRGKGGHAAMPEKNVDPVAISAQIIVALQQVVSRNANPKMPTVLSFGKIIGQGATNVIPDAVYLEGTFRTFDEQWRFEAHEKIKSISEGIATSMGATCEVDIRVGYPFLANNEAYTRKNIDWSKEYLGAENVEDLDLWMAGEDFAFYSHHVDACFYRLGTRNESKGIKSGVHTPTFDIDESALEHGMGLLAYLAACQLLDD